ncbi:MAG: hydroxysqualene dehydroxylase HpnE [Ignavibacteria bacterium]|nr:hydroxysqualene dehydroxylase HpnE [Ignavibacteria bacterium]
MKLVTIIGGGLAGLSSAVFLHKKGYNVQLFESSPKLGGRAYSFYDREKNLYFDNGQHILAGWYENTFEYLKAIGSYDKLDFQSNLEVNFYDTNKNSFNLKTYNLPAPFNLLFGLLNFKALSGSDKLSVLKIYKIFSDKKLEQLNNVAELLKAIKQTPTLIEYFWEPFILAVFNAKPENINCKIFLKILKNGFSKKSFSNLVIPKVNLNELFIDDALTYFEKNNIKIAEKEKILKLFLKDNTIDYAVTESGNKIKSDYYISAVPFFRFKELFEINNYNQYFKGRGNLHSSSIISLHLFFENEVPADLLKNNSFGMTGLIGTKVQWIFKRNPKHLSLVISASDFLDELTDESNETIYKNCLSELSKCLNGFDNLVVKDYKIIKEKRATFIPDNDSINERPNQKTDIQNFFIAGDWTNTGLPATIESAIKSSKIISTFF